MRVQFRYEITEDLGDLLVHYVDMQRTEQSELMALDTHRLQMWQEKEREGQLLRHTAACLLHLGPPRARQDLPLRGAGSGSRAGSRSA